MRHIYLMLKSLHSQVREHTWCLSLWVCVPSLEMIVSSSIHFPVILITSFFLTDGNALYFPYPFINWWTSKLFWVAGCYDYRRNEHGWANISVVRCWAFWAPRSAVDSSYGRSISRYLKTLFLDFHNACTTLHSHQQWINVTLFLNSQKHLIY